MPLEPFIRLKDPSTYIACDWDMRVDHAARVYWVAFFKKHVNTILGLGVGCAVRQGDDELKAVARADACREEFYATFDAFNANPAHADRVTILTLDQWRDELLRKHGFVDAFADLKQDENQKVIGYVAQVCDQLDELKGPEQIRAVVEGVFAGNIFDMGAAGSAALLLDGKLDFFATRRKLPARPWLVDQYDAFEQKALTNPWKKAVFFIDNAGADFCLGAIPMMRWLTQQGTQVILAANEHPTLNDMTIHDVKRWWPRLVAVEPSLKDAPIQLISTGTSEPLIDLSQVSRKLNEASHDADLVILEGMGRGVESNLNAQFKCDALNLAMIKDQMIATHLGGKLYDVVCRYR